jgi:hypothetical protein
MDKQITLWTLGITVAVVVVYLLPALAKRRRRRRLRDRPPCDWEAYIAKHYPNRPHSDIARGFLLALSKDVGVAASQIMPTDRLDGKLAVNEWWGSAGDEFANLETYLDGLFEDNGVKERAHEPLGVLLATQPRDGQRVCDVIDRVFCLLHEAQQSKVRRQGRGS